MSYSLFIASRYLTSRSKRTFISIISFMSVLGVAIGVAALVIVMSVYNGVTEEMREKILGANPHVMVMATQAGAFGPEAARGEGEVIERIRETPGVVSATPFLYAEVLLSTPQGATGLVVRGIDPVSAGESMPLLHHLESGSVEDLVRESGPAGMIVGHDLARRFNLRVGSRVNLMSPAGQRTTAGFVPKLRSFRVVGVFKSGMSDFDSRLAYVSLGAAQELMGYPDGHVSGVEAFVKNPYDARDIARDVAERLGPPFYSRNWIDMNANLFAALQLERFGMFIVLLMVILVGSFSIITSLVMLVMEKTKDIAILMSMGATAAGVRRIFMFQGAIIGAVGTSIGYVLGIVLALLLKKYQFIELPPGVYMMDTLPVIIDPVDLLVIGAVSMLLCFVATIYPARQAARLVPAEALRYE
ncbi:lipoprotein-releasing ABC transporter permease subunit [uncultured Mailhella sp.]|uniref:lipoprotein-releasing ABC transporter permease subunit n=1 Tax=uncultured Mailhella sp. TaxID=1981031 RepID=UPI0025FD7011|nr:lipoprotein-releasing ABC transporter permease subunit [uncultured Mailhella sp.]